MADKKRDKPEVPSMELTAQVPPGMITGSHKTSQGWVIFRKAFLEDDLRRAELYSQTALDDDGEPVKVVPTLFEVILQNLRCSFVAAEFPFDPNLSLGELLADIKGRLYTEDLIDWNAKVMDLNPLWDTRRDF